LTIVFYLSAGMRQALSEPGERAGGVHPDPAGTPHLCGSKRGLTRFLPDKSG
jgi:hypothetical protein